MTEKATVKKIENDIATLVCGDTAGCGSCAAHGICGGASERSFEAWNKSGLELNEGDKVEVLLPTGRTIGSAFMVMIFPLLLFFVFFYAAPVIIRDAAEGLRVLFGVIGIAAGFGINFLLNRKQNRRNMPLIIRKIA